MVYALSWPPAHWNESTNIPEWWMLWTEDSNWNGDWINHFSKPLKDWWERTKMAQDFKHWLAAHQSSTMDVSDSSEISALVRVWEKGSVIVRKTI